MDDNRTHGERVKASILECGVKLWRRNGRGAVSARAIGRMMNMTHSAILYHFDGSNGVKDAIAAEAVRVGDTVIVPELIASRHPAAASLSADDRRRYLAGC